jgi:ribosomal protein S4
MVEKRFFRVKGKMVLEPCNLITHNRIISVRNKQSKKEEIGSKEGGCNEHSGCKENGSACFNSRLV